jgi:hypothetical protein
VRVRARRAPHVPAATPRSVTSLARDVKEKTFGIFN